MRRIPLALSLLLLAAPTVLLAQVRQKLANTRSAGAVAALTPIASSTFAAVGGTATFGGTMVSVSAESVNLASASLAGMPGELMMTAAKPHAGVPASRLTVRSAAPLAPGTYGVEITFGHGRAGVVRFVDTMTGTVLMTCALDAGGWNAVQRCSSRVTVSAGLQVAVEPTSGSELFPLEITVAQYR